MTSAFQMKNKLIQQFLTRKIIMSKLLLKMNNWPCLGYRFCAAQSPKDSTLFNILPESLSIGST